MSIPEPEFRKATRRTMLGMALVFLAIGLIVAAIITGGRDGYPAPVRDQVVASCRTGGGSANACVCYINSLEKEFTFSEYTALAKRIPPPQVFSDIATACASK